MQKRTVQALAQVVTKAPQALTDRGAWEPLLALAYVNKQAEKDTTPASASSATSAAAGSTVQKAFFWPNNAIKIGFIGLCQ